MIYEYPEEFLVPVVYDNNLKNECKIKEELKSNILKFYDNLCKESRLLEDIAIEKNLQNNYERKIFEEIDNEYAESKTLNL